MAAFPRERQQEVIFGLGLLLPVVLGLTVLEGAYRAWLARSPAWVDWAGMVAEVGHGTDVSGRPLFRPGSRFGEVNFNQFGLRGPEVAIPDAPGTIRIAFLGDSKVMSANEPENLTLPALTVAVLAAEFPACQFDYLNIAGPGYGMPLLARLWTAVAPVAAPDVAVVLAGSPGALMDPLPGAEAAAAWPDRLIARSRLLQAMQRRIQLASNAFLPAQTAKPDTGVLATAFRSNAAQLVAALGATPVLALGYRSRARDEASADLYTVNAAQLELLAQEAGWRFADPILAMPTDDAHFVDDAHFGAAGLAFLAAAVASEVGAMLAPNCTVAADSLP